MMTFLSKHIRDCMDACHKVVAACERCADAAGTITCQEAARECADLAALTLRFMDRQSPLANDLAAACIKACRACANECERHETAETQDAVAATRACASVLAENSLVLSSFRQVRAVEAQPQNVAH